MSMQVDITRRLKGFTLRAKFESEGSPLAILGASGSGKSMTLRCIAGIDTPSGGRIVVNGRVLYDSEKKINLPPQKRRIGYLFQDYALFPHMTVEQNIACGVQSKGGERNEKVRRQIIRFRLQGLEKRYPAEISGGQRQRVALARILASEPQVLLLDEPFSALDAFLREAMQIEVIALLNDYGGDALMVTHSRDEAYKLCPQLMILHDGECLAIGNTKEMFRRPRSVGVARLTGCKNISPVRVVAENTVHALDWDVVWQVPGPLPANLTHVGVRAHDFKPAKAGAQNSFPVNITGRVESPFEWSVMAVNVAANHKQQIWWKFPKGEGICETPECLAVAPQDILLLNEKGVEI